MGFLENTTFQKELCGEIVKISVYECYEIMQDNGKCPIVAQVEIWDNDYYPLIVPVKIH